MTDDTIPFDKNKKAFERDLDFMAYLQMMSNHIVDTHNQLKLRARDLEKDADELLGFTNALLEGIAEKYPELVPPMDDDDELS